MTIALDIVPNPNFCLSGIHRINILILTKKVANPTLIFNFKEIPSASTVHGVTPRDDIISKASPNPNSVRPKIK